MRSLLGVDSAVSKFTIARERDRVGVRNRGVRRRLERVRHATALLDVDQPLLPPFFEFFVISWDRHRSLSGHK